MVNKKFKKVKIHKTNKKELYKKNIFNNYKKHQYTYGKGEGSRVVLRPEEGGEQKSLSEGKEGGEEKGGGLIP